MTEEVAVRIKRGRVCVERLRAPETYPVSGVAVICAPFPGVNETDFQACPLLCEVTSSIARQRIQNSRSEPLPVVICVLSCLSEYQPQARHRSGHAGLLQPDTHVQPSWPAKCLSPPPWVRFDPSLS